MDIEQLKWKGESSLKEMTESFNTLVSEMAEISKNVTTLATAMADQNKEFAEKFHEINDKVLTVNFKTDTMLYDLGDKLDIIMKTVEKNHPSS